MQDKIYFDKSFFQKLKINDIKQIDLSRDWSGNQTQNLSIDLPKQIFTAETSQQFKLRLWEVADFREIP